jgi:hypothetical protein
LLLCKTLFWADASVPDWLVEPVDWPAKVFEDSGLLVNLNYVGTTGKPRGEFFKAKLAPTEIFVPTQCWHPAQFTPRRHVGACFILDFFN